MDWHRKTKGLITGGAQGLGYAIAQELIAQGCQKLVIADIDGDKGPAAAAELSKLGADVAFLRVDMGDTESAMRMVDDAAAKMGQVTSLVNSAASTERGSILDTSPERFSEIFDINAKGPFFALQRFAQRAIDAKISASVVNILSIVVHCGLPFLAPYGASKSALLYTTKNAADTLKNNQIRVNGINVGWMDSPGEDLRQRSSHGRETGWQQEAEANLPFGKLVKPDEVARLAAYLLGPQSGVVTGSIIDFDQQVVGAYPDTNDA